MKKTKKTRSANIKTAVNVDRDVVFSKKQSEYWMNANKVWNVKAGAAASGKTHLDFYMIPRRILTETTGKGAIVLLGNTKGTIQRNIVEPLQRTYGYKNVSDISSNNTINLFGRKAYALGAGKKNMADVLRGITIEYAYGDEVVTWSQEVFEMLKSRLRLPTSKFDGTCNPDAPRHWFKQFIDESVSNGDMYYQHYVLDDNPFLPRSVKERMRRDHTGVYYDRMILGLWKRADGLIYDHFARQSDKYFIHSSEVPRDLMISIGVDFGGGPSKHAFVATGITRDYSKLYVLMSKRVETNINPQVLAEEYVKFLKIVEKRFGKVLYTYADSADQNSPKQFKTELSRQGLNRVVRNSVKGQVVERIRATQLLIGQDRLYYTELAETVKFALEEALWKPDDTETIRLDDKSTDIDTLDAFEYSFSNEIKRLISYRETNKIITDLSSYGRQGIRR